ncbi:hypothetical protein GJ633_08170 [Halorubrum sp. CBA1125]|uniref:hypothetical protein n=1 Tax=Halorubrum sp. CBA1125 TaxID=2668072 RepID=UPI0012E82864|nr:hypothetical protein [Halorubrum sp. CBA1125]MUW14645.1 hypothetical protein [Halorubrum sp. CBA1125]
MRFCGGFWWGVLDGGVPTLIARFHVELLGIRLYVRLYQVLDGEIFWPLVVLRIFVNIGVEIDPSFVGNRTTDLVEGAIQP